MILSHNGNLTFSTGSPYDIRQTFAKGRDYTFELVPKVLSELSRGKGIRLKDLHRDRAVAFSKRWKRFLRRTWRQTALGNKRYREAICKTKKGMSTSKAAGKPEKLLE